MAKLVRARQKSATERPSWENCCDWMRRTAERNTRRLKGVITLDLDNQIFYPYNVCPFCETKLPAIKAAIIAQGKWKGMAAALDCFDIDETGVPDGNYVTFAAAEQP